MARNPTPKGGTTPGEAFAIFQEEMARGFPNAVLALAPTGKDIGQLARHVSVYKPEDVRAMAKVLVDDWVSFKNKIWPKPSSDHPILQHLYRHADVLASRINSGFTGTSQVSGYKTKNGGYEDENPDDIYRDMFGADGGVGSIGY